MECPICDEQNDEPPHKSWKFNFYQVSRFKCIGCSNFYNVYDKNGSTFTIPKSRDNLE